MVFMQDFTDRFTDENLNAFRLRSDQAFAAMQQRADTAMDQFLQRYGSSSLDAYQQGMASAVATGSSAGTVVEQFRSHQGDPRATSLADTLGVEVGLGARAERPAEYSGITAGTESGPVEGQAPPSKGWVPDIKNDFEILTGGLQGEAQDLGREAMRGSRDLLKSTRSELGQMAKQEAAELRAAAQRALQEERDLRALRGRAQSEMKAAQERLRTRAGQLQDSALESVEGLATSALQRMKQAGAKRLGIDLEKPPSST